MIIKMQYVGVEKVQGQKCRDLCFAFILLLTNQVMLGELKKPCKPQFSHIQRGDLSCYLDSNLSRLLRGSNEVMHAKCLWKLQQLFYKCYGLLWLYNCIGISSWSQITSSEIGLECIQANCIRFLQALRSRPLPCPCTECSHPTAWGLGRDPLASHSSGGRLIGDVRTAFLMQILMTRWEEERWPLPCARNSFMLFY